MSMTREEIEELMNGYSPPILYDLKLVPKMFTTKVEVEINRNYCLSKEENIIIEYQATQAHIIECIHRQRPDLIVASENVEIDGARLSKLLNL